MTHPSPLSIGDQFETMTSNPRLTVGDTVRVMRHRRHYVCRILDAKYFAPKHRVHAKWRIVVEVISIPPPPPHLA